MALAGQKGRVTIAATWPVAAPTAVLGDGVRELGDLHILGSERHESAYRQPIARPCRPSEAIRARRVFYLALDDTLMRLFGSERIASLSMEKLGLEDGQSIENGHHPFHRECPKNGVGGIISRSANGFWSR